MLDIWTLLFVGGSALLILTVATRFEHGPLVMTLAGLAGFYWLVS